MRLNLYVATCTLFVGLNAINLESHDLASSSMYDDISYDLSQTYGELNTLADSDSHSKDDKKTDGKKVPAAATAAAAAGDKKPAAAAAAAGGAKKPAAAAGEAKKPAAAAGASKPKAAVLAKPVGDKKKVDVTSKDGAAKKAAHAEKKEAHVEKKEAHADKKEAKDIIKAINKPSKATPAG